MFFGFRGRPFGYPGPRLGRIMNAATSSRQKTHVSALTSIPGSFPALAYRRMLRGLTPTIFAASATSTRLFSVLMVE